MYEVAKAAAAYRRNLEKTERSRAVLHAAILDALHNGATQADIVRTTGYTRETLRKIAKSSASKPASPSVSVGTSTR